MTKLQRRTANHLVNIPDIYPPILQRVYSQRNLMDVAELSLKLSDLLPPDDLKGMTDAVALIQQALSNDWRILIVSDFDADGATSCALAMLALRGFGAAQVDYIVPNRFDFGYGLTPEIVELAKTKTPDLIITVDNGISSVEGVEAAHHAGIKVLITDHHLAPEVIPQAEAIVNPNQAGCDFQSKSIAGVGVIFYLMLALRSELRSANWFSSKGVKEPNMAELLDLVALGTVADVVPLDRNNRILVSEGLKRIRAGHCRPGIAALLKVAKRNQSALTSTDLGYGLGPRLNAAGRLDDMSTGIECLLSEQEGEAFQLASQLDAMNQDRRQIESEMQQQALQALQSLELDQDHIPPGLCLFDSRWHQGVVGILASRIKDKYHRPVIAFAESSDATADELKGSARSIKGFHIRDALDSIASKNPGLITKFGGHAMAAGLSLERSKFDEFAVAFAKEAGILLSDAQLQATVESDGSVAADEFTVQCAEALKFAGPWGQDFPEPVFDDEFTIQNMRRVGDKHLKMLLSPVSSPEAIVDAIAFNVSEEAWPSEDTRLVHLAYRLDVNEYRGNRNVQLMVEHILAAS